MQLNDSPCKVFISYARKDTVLKDALVCALASLVREELISILHDVDIGVGQDWSEQVRRFIWEADLVLLLISADFIASKHCAIEAQAALELAERDGCIVVPIIGRHCDWKNTRYSNKNLGELNGGATAAEPVMNETGHPNDRVLTEFVQKLRKDLAEVRPPHIVKHAERILNSAQVFKALTATLPTAKGLTIIARTGMGWFRDLEADFKKLPAGFELRLVVLDPESDAFEIDTALSWKPTEQDVSGAGWATSRGTRKARALEFQRRVVSQNTASLRVTPVPILYSLLAVFPSDKTAATVFVEIPIKMMNKGANRYLRVAPETCDQYVAWIERVWDAARP